MSGSLIRFRSVFALLAGVALFAGCSRRDARPNVIVILSDDQGWADIGYNNPRVYTPNLDQLAAEGAVFTRHYVMPQCTPTRVALLTGRYPGRFGVQALQASNLPAIPPGTQTLASVFRASGYATYLAGKWHLGSSPEDGPNHFGFDESYGSLAGAVGMYDHRYREGEYEHTWHRNLELIDGSENGVHTTDLITREAIRVIEGDHDGPFFLYVAYNAVHTPLDERGPFVNTPTRLDPEDSTRWAREDEIEWFHDPRGIIQSETDSEKRLFLAATHHLDHAVGEIVAALERSDRRHDTLILYSSDNGPQVSWPGGAYPDDLRLTDFNQPLPVRGQKTDVWEGGIHVPAFASWPGRIDAKAIDVPVHIVDWLPTLSALIGSPDSTRASSDGMDLSGVLFGEGTFPDRDLYWTWNRITDRWALRYGDWKIVKYGRPEPGAPEDWMLFNLEADPREQQDIARQHPDVVRDLHARFVLHRGKDQA